MDDAQAALQCAVDRQLAAFVPVDADLAFVGRLDASENADPKLRIENSWMTIPCLNASPPT